jgi:divalent metal cation (Fe/Co/Zn/Cd) transporter
MKILVVERVINIISGLVGLINLIAFWGVLQMVNPKTWLLIIFILSVIACYVLYFIRKREENRALRNAIMAGIERIEAKLPKTEEEKRKEVEYYGNLLIPEENK